MSMHTQRDREGEGEGEGEFVSTGGSLLFFFGILYTKRPVDKQMVWLLREGGWVGVGVVCVCVCVCMYVFIVCVSLSVCVYMYNHEYT